MFSVIAARGNLSGLRGRGVWRAALLALLAWMSWMGAAGAQGRRSAACRQVTLSGSVDAGREWRQGIGSGWVLRLVPIVPGAAGYTGWDLVLDRETGAGFPDALLLATPPYGSINEREIGTTYGLRAQDAIGWNPRSFRFLTDVGALREGQKLYLALAAGKRTPEAEAAARKLVVLGAHAAAGQLRIEDARLAPGVADAAPFAESWALRAARTPHMELPAPDGKPTARGRLAWMRFTVVLWLPEGWKTPQGVDAKRGSCSE
ncbi:MAG: hypothetical protein P4L03_06885 [Terracidiphilus sp.]|nr:hypothetical protein [Terracidiphilus sp.]